LHQLDVTKFQSLILYNIDLVNLNQRCSSALLSAIWATFQGRWATFFKWSRVATFWATFDAGWLLLTATMLKKKFKSIKSYVKMVVRVKKGNKLINTRQKTDD